MKPTLHRLLLAALLVTGPIAVHAQTSMVPNAMSYQGVLTDSAGTPVAPTTPENRNLEFRIYNQASGGAALWGEAQTVTVFKGNFSVILGNGTALAGTASGAAAFAAVFTNATTADLYFGISPQGGSEFAPRQKLLASAFALRAKTAETVNASAQPAGQPSLFNAVAANSLTLSGPTRVSGTNVIELGFGRTKEGSAGMIGYDAFGTAGLSIVGGGETLASRKLTLWAEGGTNFTGPISFNGLFGQLVTFNDANNGVGLQNGGPYFRSFENFAWYRKGTHDSDALDAGTGGTVMATLTPTGFNLQTGKFTGDGSGLTNLPLPSATNSLGVNGNNFIEFGRGASGKQTDAGKVGYAVFTANTLDIVGGGTTADNRKIKLWAEGGTTIGGPLDVGSTTVGGDLIHNTGFHKFGNRFGPLVQAYNGDHSFGVQDLTTYFRTATNFAWYLGGSHSPNSLDAGGGSRLAYLNSGGMVLSGYLNVGANLYVGGSFAYNLSYAFYARNSQNGPHTGGSSGLANYGIYAENRIAAPEFNAFSDSRLKNLTGRSDAARDLDTLLGLEVTDYTMRDRSAHGDRRFKKVVAQQVESVFPQAVTKAPGTVPDVLRMATARGGVIALPEAETLGLRAGDQIVLVSAQRELTTEITEVTKAGFAVKEPVEGELLVYGRKVADLRSVDYDALAMLNVSATQELYRQAKARGVELERLHRENAALAAEVEALKTAAARQDARLTAIEAGFRALARQPQPAEPAVRPVVYRGVR